MYAKNIATFLAHLLKDGALNIDTHDEITRDTLVAMDGQVTNQRIRDMLVMGPAPSSATPSAAPLGDTTGSDEYQLEQPQA
jgi:NAD(P) transhydrogenase subunit alpha